MEIIFMFPLIMLVWYCFVFFGSYSSSMAKGYRDLSDRYDKLNVKNCNQYDTLVQQRADQLREWNKLKPDFEAEAVAARYRQQQFKDLKLDFGGTPRKGTALYRHYMEAYEIMRNGEEAAIKKFGKARITKYWNWKSNQDQEKWKKEHPRPC